MSDEVEAIDSRKTNETIFRKPEVPAAAEASEEEKLKAKYPGIKGPGHTALLQKRLSKGQKYFDSGDYNMARANKGPAEIKPPCPPGTAGKSLFATTPATGDTIPTPQTVPARKASLSTSKLATGLIGMPGDTS